MMTQKNSATPLWWICVLAVCFMPGLAVIFAPKPPLAETQANVMVELTFKAARSYADPFNDVTMDVVFQDPQGKQFRIPAFWDGSNVWKVRYASPVVGQHRFSSEASNPKDIGLQGVTGTVQVKPYIGQNFLYQHGPLRVSANKRYLEHVDGTPFFWLGDTWWMGLSQRLHWPEDFKELAADRKEKGFNVIQIVAGLYPDMHPFDPRGANEAGFPWTTNYARIRPEYFDAADRRFNYLVENGFTPCIVGAWGYFLPWMGVEKAKAHWRYLVARYGALPVVWCVAGEANLPWYLTKNFPFDDREQVKGWTEVTRSLRAADPFHRPVTIHPTGIGRLSARNAMNDLSLIDFDLLQTPHGQLEAVAPTVRTVRESYADNKPIMPVINGEASYEMLFDHFETKWTRQMYWLCLMNGAAGHTYGVNGIWQVNRKGDPHGASPPTNSPAIGYGVISWDEAMRQPGSRQVGLGKKLLEKYDWAKFQPHLEWAEFAPKQLLQFEAAQWIWIPEANPAKDAAVGKRYFRRKFILKTHAIVSARMRMTADDVFEARINGDGLGSSRDWRTGMQFEDLASMLKPGTNVVAVRAENLPTNSLNPAGLIAVLEIQFSNAPPMQIVTDGSWICTTNKGGKDWDEIIYDDSKWVKALCETNYGGGPWEKLAAPNMDDLHGPQSTGIPGVVRITYVPRSDTIIERKLESGAAYRATCFDPIEGATLELGKIHADETGSWHCSPPAGCDHDWVLILEPDHSVTPSRKAEKKFAGGPR